MDEDSMTEASSREDVDKHREFFIHKKGVVRHTLNGQRGYMPDSTDIDDYRGNVRWKCHGSVREGDIFVRLEPDLRNFLLRKCCRSGDLYEVVAWGEDMFLHQASLPPIWVEDKTAYHLADVKRHPGNGQIYITNENYPPEPRKRFEIR
jgi:hypothetical protein